MAAPGSPMASVPTGMPLGICTMESRASTPLSGVAATGTPSTGSTVDDAIIPGRWAAPPAAAMITWRPRASAVRAYSNIQSGVRCADTTRTSWAMPSASSVSTAALITRRSLRLPMITPTCGASCGGASFVEGTMRWRKRGWGGRVRKDSPVPDRLATIFS